MDLPRIHIGDLQDVVVLWLPGTSSAVDDLPHPPVLVLGFTRQEVVLHHHCHPRLHIQEQGALSSLLVDAVVSRQYLAPSPAVAGLFIRYRTA